MNIVLDTGPLGLITKPLKAKDVFAITRWATSCKAGGHKIYVPEVADYEIRRELLRAANVAGVQRLDRLCLSGVAIYLPITTDAILLAADMWAQARNLGWATADRHALDGDVILAAQTLTLGMPQGDIVVATSNVRHISRYVTANVWENISP